MTTNATADAALDPRRAAAFALMATHHHSQPTHNRRDRLIRAFLAFNGLLIWLVGCTQPPDQALIVYSAADQDFAAPVFDEFESQSGIKPLGKFDVESTKTVGLVSAIMTEASRTRCDVFWNNEILHTIRLQQRGLLEPFESAAGMQYPAAFRASDNTWYGFGARARVLIVNTELVDQRDWPDSVDDLADVKWKGRAGLAKPLFGTTATHATVLFHHWGAARAQDFFRQVRQNASVLSGNRQVAIAVGRGQLAWGLTDTDDAHQVMQNGDPVEMIFPDQGTVGTLVIPNTVAIVGGAPNRTVAREFVEFLLSARTEGSLARGRSAQFPLHPQSQSVSPLGDLAEIDVMQVDFEAAAKRWNEAALFLKDEFR